MSDDEFSKQTGGIVEQLAIGAAGVAGAALFDSNLAGAMASAATFGALEYFKARATVSDTAIGAAEYAALFEEFRKLDERVATLEQKDRQDTLTKQVVFSRFARDVSEASTPEKREAIVNATVHQFDPRKGAPATRDYWLRRVREATEGAIALVNLVKQHTEVAFRDNEAFATGTARTLQEVITQPLPLSKNDVVALETLAQRIASEGFGQLVFHRFQRNIRGNNTPTYELTAVGMVFASFIIAD